MAARRRAPRTTRRADPFRKEPVYDMPNPHKIAQETVGTCTVQLVMGQSAAQSRLEITVQYKNTLHRSRDPEFDVWKDEPRRFWIGFNESLLGFPIVRMSAIESTLSLSCRYSGQGTLDRIRKLKKLRFASSDNPTSGVLLEVVEIRPTARHKLPPQSRKG